MPELELIEARPRARAVRMAEAQAERPAHRLAALFSGPIFSRTRDIFAANMTELLDRAEDPARMIRMIILEMEETLVEVRASAARCIADSKEMKRALGRLEDLQTSWTEKADLALAEDRDDLAKGALLEQQLTGIVDFEVVRGEGFADSEAGAFGAVDAELHDVAFPR